MVYNNCAIQRKDQLPLSTTVIECFWNLFVSEHHGDKTQINVFQPRQIRMKNSHCHISCVHATSFLFSASSPLFAPKPSAEPILSSALPLVLIPTVSLSPTPKLRGRLRIDIQTDTVGRLLLYWRILLVYSLSFLVCSQPLMHSEWLRTNPTEYFGRAFRGQKAFHMKWPTKSVAPRGNKSQRDGEAMQKEPAVTWYITWCCADESISSAAFGAYSHHAYAIDDPHSLLIPYYKSMPSALSTDPTACLTGFSHLGEVEWRNQCSITNKHYIANLLSLVKVLLCRSFYLLVYTHSSINPRCKLGNLVGWHFCLYEKKKKSIQE